MDWQGIDYRGGSGFLVRNFFQNSLGVPLSSGNTRIYIAEPQNDGSLKTYDFNDNTFKTGPVTTAYASGTHRKMDNNIRDTGLWTYVHTNVSNFTEGNIYLVQVENNFASPTTQTREFQFGSGVPSSVTSINIYSANQIADTTLTRDYTGVTGEADRSLMNATRFLRNKWHLNNDALYVTKEDDTTIAWSGVIQAGAGSGISSMDPY